MNHQILNIQIAELVPYDNNSRTHSAHQLQQIVDSIVEFGFTNPVLVDGDLGIIAGHGRVEAAKTMGMEQVPCIKLGHLTPEQKKAYIIADNKLALNAGWNIEMLACELKDLQESGFNIDLLGFSGEDLEGIFGTKVPDGGLTDPDDAPDLPVDPITKHGDVWVLGPHRLKCGDSCMVDDWTDLMGKTQADMVWTNPPYNVAYESKLAGKIKNDDMSASKFLTFLTDAFTCLYTVMKPGAAIYVAHADTEGLNFRAAFNAAGLKLSGCLIWQKNSLVLGRSDYQWMHEPILYGWKPGAAHRWFGGRKNTTVVSLGDDSPFVKHEDGRYSVTVGDRVLFLPADAVVEDHPSSVLYHEKPSRSSEHPTMKPVSLVERMLKNNAKPGDVIIDAFGGSGTTLMAAQRLGMTACLMELDPKFCDVIVGRWENYTNKKAVLEDKNGETN